MTQKLLLYINALIIGFFFFLAGIAFAAWSTPTADPPGANAPTPLDVSNVGQTKIGGLTLNTGGALDGLIVSSGRVTLPDGTIDESEVSFNYAGSSSKGGAATTASALVANGSNCPLGQYARGVSATGVAEDCTTDGVGTGTVTSLSQGSGIDLTPDTITSNGTIAIDASYTQRRVSSPCDPGSSIRVINQDGSISCQNDGIGMEYWIVANDAGTNQFRVSDKEKVKFAGTGGSWSFTTTQGNKTVTFNAAGSSGTVTSVDTGNGLTGGPITSSGTISIKDEGVDEPQLKNGAVALNKIKNIGGPGVIGRSISGAGTPEEIKGTTVGDVLRIYSGLNLGFGKITGSSISDESIENADIKNDTISEEKLVNKGFHGVTQIEDIGIGTGTVTRKIKKLDGSGDATSAEYICFLTKVAGKFSSGGGESCNVFKDSDGYWKLERRSGQSPGVACSAMCLSTTPGY